MRCVNIEVYNIRVRVSNEENRLDLFKTSIYRIFDFLLLLVFQSLVLCVFGNIISRLIGFCNQTQIQNIEVEVEVSRMMNVVICVDVYIY